MSKRSPCPRSFKDQLKREVYNRCPLCGSSGPLVIAHTTKKYSEVKWKDPSYLLAICNNCETKVTNNIIDVKELENVKKKIRKLIPNKDSNIPFQIPPISLSDIYFGNTLIASTKNIIVNKRTGYPVIYLEKKEDVYYLNARLYNKQGTVVNAIDNGRWTAEKKKFYEFKTYIKDGVIKISLEGINDDTDIKLLIYPDRLVFLKAKLYIEDNIFRINEKNGKIIIDGPYKMEINHCTYMDNDIAFLL